MKVDKSGWKWINGWKWMKVDENGWKWMKMDESGWKWMKMDERWWKWMNVSAVLRATCSSDVVYYDVFSISTSLLYNSSSYFLPSYILHYGDIFLIWPQVISSIVSNKSHILAWTEMLFSCISFFICKPGLEATWCVQLTQPLMVWLGLRGTAF